MAVPSPDEWSKIAQDYKDKWNMPNCIGSIDGKHCRIQRPPNAGSLFYNYKDFHSIVLLCFTMIEQGNKAVLDWVMKEGLIPSRYECPKCKKDMSLVERKGTIDGFEWRCRVQSKENPHFVCRSVRKDIIKEKGIENVTVESLVKEMTPKGRALVPQIH
ncbi:uncharacterized protein TNCV_1345141 [Trichonephila clavipes]|nr:uncharacterized protein TNCV_1345141 [Trichonephila clavipes]